MGVRVGVSFCWSQFAANAVRFISDDIGVAVLEVELSIKPILVHSCRQASLDDGRPFHCRCRKHVTVRRAEVLVSSGQAISRRLPNGDIDERQIILIRRELPRPARTISDKDIQRACVLGERYAQKRIEVYGEAI